MPIGYLDVPPGIDDARKTELVRTLYEALHEAYPFPDDTRIFLREWPLDGISQNGVLSPTPVKPVFMVHVPQGAEPDAKRTLVRRVDRAVRDAYGLPEVVTFIHEHSLDLVAVDGVVLAEDQQRVVEQQRAYGDA